MPDGNDRSLGAIGDIQLGEYGADVVAHRPLRQAQPLGDVCIRQTVRNQAQHIPFPFGELLSDQRPRLCLLARHLSQ